MEKFKIVFLKMAARSARWQIEEKEKYYVPYPIDQKFIQNHSISHHLKYIQGFIFSRKIQDWCPNLRNQYF